MDIPAPLPPPPRLVAPLPPPPPITPAEAPSAPFALSQSRIKRINATDFCPLKFLKCDVEKAYSELPSVSMIRGQLFEYLAFGSLNREGKVPQLPRTSRGKVTAEEKRIILQASEIKRVLPLYGIRVIATNVPMAIEWNTGLFFTMVYDVFCYWQRPADPDGVDRSGYYILDAKLTGNIHSDYGDFCWGRPWDMNHLQPHIYKESAERVLVDAQGRRREIGFVYAVFDYKARPEHKLIEIRSSIINKSETKEQIRTALVTLEEVNDEGFPPRPSFSQCKTCPVPDCPKRQSVPDVQVVY